MTRDARHLRVALVVYALALAMLVMAGVFTWMSASECRELGGHYTITAGCTTPSGRTIPLR